MYKLYAHGEDIAYSVKKYIADTEEDLKSLPTTLYPGSSVFIISNSKTYMMNCEGEWVLIQAGGGLDAISEVETALEEVLAEQNKLIGGEEI